MKKSEHKFNRGAKKQIDINAQENKIPCFWKKQHNPIFIPKRKKKK